MKVLIVVLLSQIIPIIFGFEENFFATSTERSLLDSSSNCFQCALSEYHRPCSNNNCIPLSSADSSCVQEWANAYTFNPNGVKFWERTIGCEIDIKGCPSSSNYLYDYNTFSEYIPEKNTYIQKNDMCVMTFNFEDSWSTNNDPMTIILTITRVEEENSDIGVVIGEYPDDTTLTSRLELTGKKVEKDLGDIDTMKLYIRARKPLSQYDIHIKVENTYERIPDVTPAMILGFVFVGIMWILGAICLLYNSCCRKKHKKS